MLARKCLMKLENQHSPRKKTQRNRQILPCSPIQEFIYLFASSAQGGEESPEIADTLQLNGKEQNDEDHSLN